MNKLNIRKYLNRTKSKFKALWEYKIFRYALLIQGFYFILSLILTLIFFKDRNDFLVYYTVGEVFLKDINNLYNQTNYLWPFRYFPLSALMFIPFYLMGFNLGFLMFNIINLILNLLISVILYKIIILIRGENHEKEEKRVLIYISIFLMGLPNLFNYILGQINLYVTALILISLFIYLKHSGSKWEFLASFILGVSIVIKPITIFMIPFLLSIQFDWKNRKLNRDVLRSLIRLIGVILPISLNFIIFLVFPNLLKGFMATNFTSSEPSQINHSFSITKLIINLFYFVGFNDDQVLRVQMPLFLIILIVISILGFGSFLTRKDTKYDMIYAYSFGILVMFLCYFDTWDHHLLTFMPLLIIILFNLPRQSDLAKKIFKPSIIFLSFFDLAFMGLYFLVKDFFPFNFASTIFLILIFYGLIKYNNFKKT